MKNAPAFQLYAADFYMDTASWTIEEVGIYTRLLFYQWVNGSIPMDGIRLSRIAGCSLKTFRKSWDEIHLKFSPWDHENLVNLRLEESRKKQEEYHNARKSGGIATAKKRWGEKKRDSSANSSANSSSVALHSSSSNKEKREKKIISDDEWLKTLEDNPIYEGIDVRVLYGKMLVWCQNNGKKPTRRRFVNWLNREDRPVGNGNGKPKPKRERLPTQAEELAAFNAEWERDHAVAQ